MSKSAENNHFGAFCL